ncbi:MAG: aminotransferase class I/II-fold pyridoxal phosphate-dependent enzyme [Clostridiales bacterium]|nr:MAG: aminotransferase class I/II-fold pyridoxal phosphate-dependent enzyme [Clostridiales bacterium]
MEFVTPKEISAAIAKTANERVLGYTEAYDEYYEAVLNWMKRKHGFAAKKEWILTTPGVVPSLSILIQAVTKPCEGVILLTPVYYPFDMVTIAKTRHIVYSVLKNVNGRYEIDFEDLERKAKDKNNTAILFCNPHNPVGRVWTKEELEKVGKICVDNGVFIIDDEIHNDLIMPGVKHTLFANLESVKQNIAVCTAPSKTFNLAGVQCSNIFHSQRRSARKSKSHCACRYYQRP